MNKPQKFIAILLISAHFYCWVSQREIWPFSPYPMYSRNFRPQNLSSFELYGVLKNGEEQKVEIRRHLYPFWAASFNESYIRRADPNQQKLFLEKMLELYQERQSKSFGQWPDFQKFRLYQVTSSWPDVLGAQKLASSETLPPVENKQLEVEVGTP